MSDATTSDLSATASYKRRRIVEPDPAPVYSLDAYDDDGELYVPVKKRRELELARLAGKLSSADSLRRRGEELARFEAENEAKARADSAALSSQSRFTAGSIAGSTLLHDAQAVKQREIDAGKTDADRARDEQDAMAKSLTAVKRKLASAQELAKDVLYSEPLTTSWRPPKYILDRTEEENDTVRQQHHILVETMTADEDVPAPVPTFREMKLPEPLLGYLKQKRILAPTPIQIQGMPIALSGRDMIGVAFTGSGKTMAFSLPVLCMALEDELRLPFVSGEGPIGIIMCPSRELARQTYEGLLAMADECAKAGLPQIRTLLAIGGINIAEQNHVFRSGFHIVVATPGRLVDLLTKKRFTLDWCRYLCLDEADRMIEESFEEDLRNILGYFKHQRQTLLFSATMPQRIRDFAQQSLIRPITVNVGRAGAANLDVIQEVEYVKQEAKMVYLLECLQKTPPPVIVFSDNKNEVDDVQEYLLLKGVEAVAIHGSKTQEEREYAIRSFKAGKKDVMVASGVASKGLDFSEIQHVINYTMPKDIEDYVHQIGRTGRGGKTGIATTFINMSLPEQTLLDLRYLLVEAKQRVPPFLLAVEDPRAKTLVPGGGAGRGCQNCGGLGHDITTCPKLEEMQRRAQKQHSGRDNGGW